MNKLLGGIPSFPIIGIILVVLFCLVIIGVIIGLKIVREQPSESNLLALIKKGTTDAVNYPTQMPNRKGLIDYLLLNKIGNLPNNQLALTNFYVMTANLGGYFSPVNKAAFCKEAIQYAIQAGARCIVFDIWPDISKGATRGPILSVRQNDSSTEIFGSAYYTMKLTDALIEVRKWAFEDSANSGNQDPMFLFLRFRGTSYLTNNTLTGTATALYATLQQYRLPDNYYLPTNNPLPSTPINADVLRRKIIILSDQTGAGTSFANWVNNPVAPANSPFQRKTIGTPGEVHSLTKNQLLTLDTTCTTNLMACAPLPEDTDTSESNSWDWKGAQNAGIQFCALNLWKKDSGVDPKNGIFGTYSFMIKSGSPPVVEGFASRYTIERVPPPIPVKPLGYGDGTVTVK